MTIFHTNSRWVRSMLALAVLMLGGVALRAENKTITISPDNTHPVARFYSNTAGEIHNLTVNVAAGYEFKTGPTLEFNPSTLWTSTGTNTYSMASMDGRAQLTAGVLGTIGPIGGSGGSGGGDIPFDVTMLTHYFTMAFVTPTGGTVPEDQDVNVSVALLNAIGAPTTGSVSFSTGLGTFGSSSFVGGLASATLTVTATLSTEDTITASATGVDITATEVASGSATSQELSVVEYVEELVITLDQPSDAIPVP